MLDLSPREMLTTTHAVRKRLDLTKPVEREVIEDCISIAQQAPTRSNIQDNQIYPAITSSFFTSTRSTLHGSS